METADRRDLPRPVNKSPTAFRTIAEVAQELDLPQHVLRFWETKFPQVKPLKRGGGRRYYRPEDLALLRRIRELLHEQGYTIRGAQKLLRQRSAKAPAGPEVDGERREDRQASAPAPLDPRTRAELRRTLADLESLRRLLAGLGS